MTVDRAREPDRPSASPPRRGAATPAACAAALRWCRCGAGRRILRGLSAWRAAPGILAGMATALIALAIQAWRLGRLDPIVMVPMAVILAQGTVAALAGSVELYLAAPAVEACIWGLVLIGSVVAGRPLVPMIARELDIVPSRIAGFAGPAAGARASDAALGTCQLCQGRHSPLAAGDAPARALSSHRHAGTRRRQCDDAGDLCLAAVSDGARGTQRSRRGAGIRVVRGRESAPHLGARPLVRMSATSETTCVM